MTKIIIPASKHHFTFWRITHLLPENTAKMMRTSLTRVAQQAVASTSQLGAVAGPSSRRMLSTAAASASFRAASSSRAVAAPGSQAGPRISKRGYHEKVIDHVSAMAPANVV